MSQLSRYVLPPYPDSGSNLYNSRFLPLTARPKYLQPLTAGPSPNIYNRLPPGRDHHRRCPVATGTPKQSEIEFGAGGHQIRFLESHDAAVLWQLVRQNNPKSNLVPGGTKFDFWNPTTPLSCGNWHRPVATGTTLIYLLPLTASR